MKPGKGDFRCVPMVCRECGDAVYAISRIEDIKKWGAEIESLSDERRDCVREFLRQLVVRTRTADAARAAYELKHGKKAA